MLLTARFLPALPALMRQDKEDVGSAVSQAFVILRHKLRTYYFEHGMVPSSANSSSLIAKKYSNLANNDAGETDVQEASSTHTQTVKSKGEREDIDNNDNVLFSFHQNTPTVVHGSDDTSAKKKGLEENDKKKKQPLRIVIGAKGQAESNNNTKSEATTTQDFIRLIDETTSDKAVKDLCHQALAMLHETKSTQYMLEAALQLAKSCDAVFFSVPSLALRLEILALKALSTYVLSLLDEGIREIEIVDGIPSPIRNDSTMDSVVDGKEGEAQNGSVEAPQKVSQNRVDIADKKLLEFQCDVHEIAALSGSLKVSLQKATINQPAEKSMVHMAIFFDSLFTRAFPEVDFNQMSVCMGGGGPEALLRRKMKLEGKERNMTPQQKWEMGMKHQKAATSSWRGVEDGVVTISPAIEQLLAPTPRQSMSLDTKQIPPPANLLAMSGQYPGISSGNLFCVSSQKSKYIQVMGINRTGAYNTATEAMEWAHHLSIEALVEIPDSTTENEVTCLAPLDYFPTGFHPSLMDEDQNNSGAGDTTGVVEGCGFVVCGTKNGEVIGFQLSKQASITAREQHQTVATPLMSPTGKTPPRKKKEEDSVELMQLPTQSYGELQEVSSPSVATDPARAKSRVYLHQKGEMSTALQVTTLFSVDSCPVAKNTRIPLTVSSCCCLANGVVAIGPILRLGRNLWNAVIPDADADDVPVFEPFRVRSSDGQSVNSHLQMTAFTSPSSKKSHTGASSAHQDVLVTEMAPFGLSGDRLCSYVGKMASLWDVETQSLLSHCESPSYITSMDTLRLDRAIGGGMGGRSVSVSDYDNIFLIALGMEDGFVRLWDVRCPENYINKFAEEFIAHDQRISTLRMKGRTIWTTSALETNPVMKCFSLRAQRRQKRLEMRSEGRDTVSTTGVAGLNKVKQIFNTRATIWERTCEAGRVINFNFLEGGMSYVGLTPRGIEFRESIQLLGLP